MGGKVTCVPNLDSKPLPNKGTGRSGMYKNSCVTWCPPSDIFRVGLSHNSCVYHHLRLSGLWMHRPVKSTALHSLSWNSEGDSLPLESLRRVLPYSWVLGAPLLRPCEIAARCLSRRPLPCSGSQPQLGLSPGAAGSPTAAGWQGPQVPFL